MAREDLHFRLRIPEALKAQIEASAKVNNRSMTAEIVSRLERSFDLDDGLVELTDGVDEHERRIAKLEDRMEDVLYMLGKFDPNRRD